MDLQETVKRVVNDIKEHGYSRVEDFLTPEQSVDIMNAMDKFNKENYSENNLLNRVCYKREESQNRQGDAYMVSLGKGELNSIVLKDKELINAFGFYNAVIAEMVGEPMKTSTRCMLNCQQYFDKSLPVWSHYDGEFFDFEHTYNEKYKEKELIINRGLLPRYVMVLVLFNENGDKGTYIRHHDSQERLDIPNRSLDMIIFDNIAMRHGVPELDKPRMMIGFRNFDYYPFYFKKEPDDNTWEKLDDEINPGWVKSITENESITLQKEFKNEWKEKAEEVLKTDPAF